MTFEPQHRQVILQVVDSTAPHWMAFWVISSSRQASALAHWLKLRQSLQMALITRCGQHCVVSVDSLQCVTRPLHCAAGKQFTGSDTDFKVTACMQYTFIEA